MASSQPTDPRDSSLVLQTEPLPTSEQEKPDDFAQDELLRQLRVDQWFAIADQDTPFWWH